MKRRDFLKKGSFLGLALLSLKTGAVLANGLQARFFKAEAKKSFGGAKKSSLDKKQNLMAVGVKIDKCVGCKVCMRTCPYQAIEFNEKTYKAKINQNRCKSCGACVKACPLKAIDLKAKV